MSLISALYETYNNLSESPPEGLLPIAHSMQRMDIEVTIGGNGDFISALKLNGEQTIIPVSEKSMVKSGKHPINHPLCDKLQYLAGDCQKYINHDIYDFYSKYISDLKDWCDSPYSNKKIKILYEYLSKKTLIGDLIKNKILELDSDGYLLNGENDLKPMVRFCIDDGTDLPKVWQDNELQNDYVNYYLSKCSDKKFCYLSGKEAYCEVYHPKGILPWSYNAMLMCDNFGMDERFGCSDRAFTISYEVSQKAHNALKYLIGNQGVRVSDRCFVLWGTRNEKIPPVCDDTLSFFDDGDESAQIDTKEAFAKEFKKAIFGYKADISSKTDLILAGFDAATVGRLAMTFYREYKGEQGNEFIDRISLWHTTGAWRQDIYSKKAGKRVVFYGVPSIITIAEYAYGTEQGDFVVCDPKIKKQIVEHLLMCVCDAKPVPRDVVSMLVKKSFRPQNYKNDYNWQSVVAVACSMYKKYLYDYEREEWNMEIKNCDDLSYNCGRLLAVADEIEYLGQGDTKRQTNAMRYFTRFTEYPCETWNIINKKLVPYLNALGEKANYLNLLKGEISAMIDPQEFAAARHLDGKMILGFDSQKQAIISLFKNKKNNQEGN